MYSNSLRRHLLKRLLWPLIPILLIGAGLAYLFAIRAASDANDLGLLDDALDLAKQIHFQQGKVGLELPLAAQQMLLVNNDDHVSYAAWDESQRVFAGESKLLSLVLPLVKENHRFQDIKLGGIKYRAVVLRDSASGEPVYIAVAQTTHGRTRLSNRIFLGMLIPEALLALVSISVILFGVKRGLSPVESLRDEIISRSPTDLRPIAESPAPSELRPVIHGINELLETLAKSFADHRRFIADAAHQLRTPLAALSSQLEVNLQQPPENTAALLRQLLATTQRTSHLANQLLSLAKLEHTEQALCQKSAVKLYEIVRETAADFVTLAARKNSTLEFDIQPCTLNGNALLLRELLANLLSNAIHYTPSGGHVQVRLTNENKLSVEDNGIGVAESELSMLGVPFHRMTSAQPEGCGLGLAIVLEIARLHQAEIHFERVSERGGLRVSVQFTA